MSQDGTIIINREKAWVGAVVRYFVEIDNHEYAELKNGESIALAIPSGNHSVRIRPNWRNTPSPPLEVRLHAGEIVRLVCGPTSYWAASGGPDVRLGFEPLKPAPATPGQRTARPERSGHAEGSSVVVRETHRTEEPLGIEYRAARNPTKEVSVTRVLRVSREWSRTVVIDTTDARQKSVSGKLGPDWLKIEATANAELRRTYAITSENREQFSEEITLQIPSGISVRLGLSWKKIWQHGEIEVRGDHGAVATWPYRVVVGITFDQSLSDL